MLGLEVDRFGRGGAVLLVLEVAVEVDCVFKGDQRSFYEKLAGDFGGAGDVVSSINPTLGDEDPSRLVFSASSAIELLPKANAAVDDEGHRRRVGNPDLGVDGEVPVDKDQGGAVIGEVYHPVEGMVSVDQINPIPRGKGGSSIGSGFPLAESLPKDIVAGDADPAVVGGIGISLGVEGTDPALAADDIGVDRGSGGDKVLPIIFSRRNLAGEVDPAIGMDIPILDLRPRVGFGHEGRSPQTGIREIFPAAAIFVFHHAPVVACPGFEDAPRGVDLEILI